MTNNSSDKSVILAVDHNQRNLELLSQFLSREGYEVLQASSLEEFDRTLTDFPNIQLVLLDISGFDRQIWDCCEKLRSSQIPFLVISPKQSAAIQQESLVHGAQSVMVKPLVLREFLAIIRSLIGESA